MNLEGATQPYRDSVISMPRVDLIAGLNRIDKLTVDSMRLDAEVKRLNQKIAATANTMFLLNNRIETYKELVAKYKLTEANQDERLKLTSDVVTSMKKEIRKANTRGFLYGGFGIALVLLTTYLIHK